MTLSNKPSKSWQRQTTCILRIRSWTIESLLLQKIRIAKPRTFALGDVWCINMWFIKCFKWENCSLETNLQIPFVTVIFQSPLSLWAWKAHSWAVSQPLQLVKRDGPWLQFLTLFKINHKQKKVFSTGIFSLIIWIINSILTTFVMFCHKNYLGWKGIYI